MTASQRFIVSELSVEAVSGPTCYPDEGGFSGQWGEVATDEAEVADSLMRLAEEGSLVALQCGRLVVVGKLMDASKSVGRTQFRVEVFDVQFAAQTSRGM